MTRSHIQLKIIGKFYLKIFNAIFDIINFFLNPSSYVSRLDRSVAQPTFSTDESSNQIEMAVDVITSFGEKFYDILCHDCTGGSDLCKTLAFSCVDMFLDIDHMSSFIHFISNRGKFKFNFDW